MLLPCLSLKQPWASLIAQKKKTIETRVWTTDWRGPLLIAASAQPRLDGMPTRQALCIVNLTDCRPMRREDQADARCEIYERAQAWLLQEIWPIVPFAVKGRLGLYWVDVTVAAVCDDDLYTRIEQMSIEAWKTFKADAKSRWVRYT